MKNLFKALAVAVLGLVMASCASDIDKKFSEITSAIAAQDWTKVKQIAEDLYAQKDQCSVDNLINLSTVFNTLAEQASNNEERLGIINKVIDCYNIAVGKDGNLAKKCMEALNVDMSGVVSQYKELVPQYEAAIEAEKLQQQVVENAENAVEGVVEGAVEGAKNKANEVVNEVADKTNEVVNTAVDKTNEAVKKANDAAKDAIKKL